MPQYVEQIFKRIAAISEDLKLFLFAHLGDGNFHATVSTGYPIPDLESAVHSAMYEGLSKAGGSFTTEHGIGIEKRSALKRHVPEENPLIMNQLKQMLDPNRIMNPGKVL